MAARNVAKDVDGDVDGTVVVLRFDGRRLPGPLADLPIMDIAADGAGLDAAAGTARRVVVIGTDADLAAVLSWLLRTERLDVEVVPPGTTARRARTAAASRVPLIRDETGRVLVAHGHWLPPEGSRNIIGEGVVDDTVLFDGAVPKVRIEPTGTMPGLRARVERGPLRRGRWTTGRAAQLGTTGARVVRDGVAVPREVRRSTFYRHTEGWLRVR